MIRRNCGRKLSPSELPCHQFICGASALRVFVFIKSVSGFSLEDGTQILILYSGFTPEYDGSESKAAGAVMKPTGADGNGRKSHGNGSEFSLPCRSLTQNSQVGV